MPDWAPTPDLVATLLRSRTQGAATIAAPGGEELGRFTDSTRPTRAQVEKLIAAACVEVGALFPGRQPCTDDLEAAAGVAAGYKVCQLIEAGGDSTRAEGDAFDQFEKLYDRASAAVAAAIIAGCPLDRDGDGTPDDPADDGGALAPTGRGARRCLIGPSSGVW